MDGKGKGGCVAVELGVLGPLTAWNTAGERIALKGPLHQRVLARLVVARGRVVPFTMMVDDLWTVPPSRAVGALRTFIGDLRQALEPERAPRGQAHLIVTEGSGYAWRGAPESIDAEKFEQAIEASRALPHSGALKTLDTALALWRGGAYADFGEQHWAWAESSRLQELRLLAMEMRAQRLLDVGKAREAIPALNAHVGEHPWREEGWRLLALALYQSSRQGDALAVLRRSRGKLVGELGLTPGNALRQLEADILQQDPRLTALSGPGSAAGRVWAQATASYNENMAVGARGRLRSSVDLLRSLAVAGGEGLIAARRHRLEAILAAEEFGDAELTARVIGAYDVPAIWTRADDAEQGVRIVDAAQRTLSALPLDGHDDARARLLATIAVESRGTTTLRGAEAAAQAERIARRQEDPALLAFALNGVFMQSFRCAGQSQMRDKLGTELVVLATRHGLPMYQILGRLIGLQARCAVGDLAGATVHATELDRLGQQYDSPLTAVFTTWYSALFLAMSGQPRDVVASAYREAASHLLGAGMPGVSAGLLPLALLSLTVAHGDAVDFDPGTDWGPYLPWVQPLLLDAKGDRSAAMDALREMQDPPSDHLFEALWCFVGVAAVNLGDHRTMERARAALSPAAGELAGAGTGMFTLGPVSKFLDQLSAALNR
ncbi:BTAD domain-containing putative transcriptional regulator [Arthrobacter cryoconiti]